MWKPGESPRVELAWAVIYFTSVQSALGLLLLLWRGNRNPLAMRNRNLLALTCIGVVGTTVGTFLQDVYTWQTIEEYLGGCWEFLWLLRISPQILAGPWFLMGLRLWLIFRFEQLKAGWIRKRLTPQDIQTVRRYRRLHSTGFLLLYFLPMLLFNNSVTVIVTFSMECANNAPALRISSLWLTGCYAGMVGIGVYLLRKQKDALGIKKELGTIALLVGGCSALSQVLLLAKGADGPNYWWIYQIALNFYLFFSIILRGLQTFPSLRPYLSCKRCCRCYCCCRNKVADAGPATETTSEIISTELGYRYFLAHVRREFAEENLVCLKSIGDLQHLPHYGKFTEIFDKFIARDAPLAVNISGDVRQAAIDRARGLGPGTAPEVLSNSLNDVQEELRILLDADSLRRFQRSKLYQKYLAREPFVDRDGDFDSRTPPGASSQLGTARGTASLVTAPHISIKTDAGSVKRAPLSPGKQAVKRFESPAPAVGAATVDVKTMAADTPDESSLLHEVTAISPPLASEPTPAALQQQHSAAQSSTKASPSSTAQPLQAWSVAAPAPGSTVGP